MNKKSVIHCNSEFIQAFIRLDFDYFNCFKDFPKDWQKDRRLLFRIPDLKRRTSRNNRREKRYFRCRNSVKAYLSAGLFFVFTLFSGAQTCTKFFPMQLFSFFNHPRFRLIIMLFNSQRYLFRTAGARRTYNHSKR